MARIFLIVALLVSCSTALAVEVRLQRLQDFDPGQHGLGVNVEVEVSGGCRPSQKKIKKDYETLLGLLGFNVTSLQDSQLEFAVSVTGFPTSGDGGCGLRMLSSVRQIPTIRILRLSPGSTSDQFRLWKVENLVTGERDALGELLQQQVQRDVFEFYEKLKGSPR